MTTAKPKRARWFLTFVGECPLCGRDQSYKVAQYTSPPLKAERYRQLPLAEAYDQCEL